MIRQLKGIHSLCKVEHGIHEEASIASRVKGVSPQYQSIQTDHRICLRVKHTSQSNEKNFKNTRLFFPKDSISRIPNKTTRMAHHRGVIIKFHVFFVASSCAWDEEVDKRAKGSREREH
jgi:hypothetical protein